MRRATGAAPWSCTRGHPEKDNRPSCQAGCDASPTAAIVDSQSAKRADTAKGFVVLSKRWLVERTIAWLNRCRRVSKDWDA